MDLMLLRIDPGVYVPATVIGMPYGQQYIIDIQEKGRVWIGPLPHFTCFRSKIY